MLCVVLLAVALQACSSSFVMCDVGDNVTLRVLSHVDAGSAMDGEQTRAFSLSSAGAGLNVIYGWKHKEVMKKDIAHHLAVEQHGPGVIGWYAGGDVTRSLVRAGKLRGLGALLKRSGLDSSIPESLLKGATDESGEPYVMPTDYYHWGVYYNKELLSDVGIAVPKTMEEFISACAALQAAGIQPITIGYSWRWPAAGWFDYLNMRLNGPEFHVELTSGAVNMTDARVFAVFALWRKLLPYFPQYDKAVREDWREMATALADKSAGFALIGDFLRLAVPAEEYSKIDFFQFPIVNSSVAVGEDAPCDGVVIPSNTDNVEAAERLVEYYGSPEYQKGRLNVTAIPSNTEAAAFITDDVVKRGAAMVAAADFVLQFYDRDTTPEMASRGMDSMLRFLRDPDCIEAELGDLEVYRQEIYFKVAATPVIEPNGGSFTDKTVRVNMTSLTDGATIFCTLDGSMPSEQSQVYDPEKGLTLSFSDRKSWTVRCIAFLKGLSSSSPQQATFTFQDQEVLVINSISDRTALVGTVVVAISLVYLLGLIAWVTVKRNEPIVKASAPLFVVLTICGSALLLASVWMTSVDVGQPGVTLEVLENTCHATLWVFTLGWGLCVGSLLVRSYRIASVFAAISPAVDSGGISSGRQEQRFADSSLLRYVAMLTLGQVVVLLCWLLADPPHVELRMSTAVGNQAFYQCQSENAPGSIFFYAAKLVMLIPACLFAYRTRNVVSAFNDSTVVAFVVYNVVLIGALSGAISVAIVDLPNVAYMVRLVGVTLSCLASGSALVLPKAYIVYMQAEKNSTRAIIDAIAGAREKNRRTSEHEEA